MTEKSTPPPVAAPQDILTLWQDEERKAKHRALRALIIQPGALGDCILTLPLVQTLKEIIGLGGVDILGHTDTLGILPQRSGVDSVRSQETVELHRLFASPQDFNLADRDPLIYAFSEYTWIISFLGDPHGPFEQNLIYTVNCSHSAEIITLPLKPPTHYRAHITHYYQSQFARAAQWKNPLPSPVAQGPQLQASVSDHQHGQQLLREHGLDPDRPLTLIHPGSGGQQKCWHLDNFISIAQGLRKQDKQIAFLIGPVENERWPTTERQRLQDNAPLIFNLPLEDSLAVLSAASQLVANDSGISHLGAALSIPTLTLFGPSSPEVYRPLGPKVQLLRDSSPDFSRTPSPTLQTKVQALLS